VALATPRPSLGPSRHWLFLAGFALLVILLFPGFISKDSVVQILQAREGVYRDWHPPLVTLLWAQADRFLVAGTAGILIVHLSLIWWSLCAITTALWKKRGRWLPFLVCFYPPFFAIEGAIWKDLLTVGTLLLAFACAQRPASWRTSVVFWLAVFVSAASRYNAWVACIPLVFMWARPWQRWRRLGVTAATSIVLLVGSAAANKALTDVPEHPWQSVAMHDVIGAAAVGGKSVLPSWCPDCKRVAIARVADGYRPYYWTESYQNMGLRQPQTDEERAALKTQWLRTLRKYPIAYLIHRARTFAALTSMTMEPWGSSYYQRPSKEKWLRSLGHDFRLSRVQEAIQTGLRAIQQSFLFRPWLYLALALCLVFVNWRWSRGRSEMIVLLLSGLGCELSLFVMAPSADYRYSLWLIITTVMAAAVIAADYRAARQGRLA